MNRTLAVLAEAPPGKKALAFDGGAPCGNHHPADNIWPAGGRYTACKNSKGVVMNFTGIWWGHGTPREPFNFTPMGGQFDFVCLPARTPHGGASYVWCLIV